MAPRRIKFLRFCLAAAIVLLCVQLWYWQDYRSEDLAMRACRQRLLVLEELNRPRGGFCDRYGRPLTDRTWSTISFFEPGDVSIPAGTGAAGSVTVPVPLRYGSQPLAVHVLGYLNPGDGRGAAGLEEVFDSVLSRGSGQVLASVVDGQRRTIPGLGLRLVDLPFLGPDPIGLTIDADLQQKVEEIADDALPKGAIVVMDPWTGEILAMASRPDFDPNDPARYLDAPDSPFMNRAISTYHPGSIFKLAVLAAALEDDPDCLWGLYDDPGHVRLGNVDFSCPGGSHGLLTLADALAYSCNCFFIELGLSLGPERILDMAERLGLGLPAMKDLPGEDPGNLPTGLGQTPGDVANTVLGQQDVYCSPVQVARMVSAIANGGRLVPCHVLLDDPPADGPAGTRVLSPQAAGIMRRLMAGVARYGTGRAAALPEGVGGKTGTAQSGRVDGYGRPVCHAWFAGFAPLDVPEYVAAVFVEEGGSGGGDAAPIFRRVMEAALAE